MNYGEIRQTRDLIDKIGNPQGLYAEEVMIRFRKTLDALEALMDMQTSEADGCFPDVPEKTKAFIGMLIRQRDEALAEKKATLLQLGEVTAHRDRLRDMMNDVRGLLFCPPKDLECQIMRRIEDEQPTEKRNHIHHQAVAGDTHCGDCGESLASQ